MPARRTDPIRRKTAPGACNSSTLVAATQAPLELHGRRALAAHPGFILAALVLTLTLGAGWGAWLLWQIGLHGHFSGVPTAHVIAHGEAQLWGFIVLFVVGISLRTAFQGVLRRPMRDWISRSLLALTLVGVAGSVLWSVFPERSVLTGVASAAALCLMSLGLWSLQTALLRGKWQATWARAVWASGLWLTAWAVTKRSSLAVLLAEHPWIEDRLRPGGTRYLERTRSVPSELTLGSFAESEGFDATELVSRINTWLAAIPSDSRRSSDARADQYDQQPQTGLGPEIRRSLA